MFVSFLRGHVFGLRLLFLGLRVLFLMELFSVFGRRPLHRIHHLTREVGPCTSEWPVKWSRSGSHCPEDASQACLVSFTRRTDATIKGKGPSPPPGPLRSHQSGRQPDPATSPCRVLIGSPLFFFFTGNQEAFEKREKLIIQTPCRARPLTDLTK